MQLGRGQSFEAAIARQHTELVALLLYGQDPGLISERASHSVTVAAGDASDPFRVTVLRGEDLTKDPARLGDEMASLSLLGGRRVVWIRGGTETAAASHIAAFLKEPFGDSFLVIEGGDLAKSSALRQIAEARPDCLAIGCYRDQGRDLADLIRSRLAQDGLTITPDALAYLQERLSGERLITLSELEKLSLLMRGAQSVTRESLLGAIGDLADVALPEIAQAAAEGAITTLDRELDRALSGGESPVAVIRVALRHFQRMHVAAAQIAAGKSAQAALQALQPPVFAREQPRFTAALRRWDQSRLEAALAELSRAERECKTTGLPDTVMAAEALLRVARLAKTRPA